PPVAERAVMLAPFDVARVATASLSFGSREDIASLASVTTNGKLAHDYLAASYARYPEVMLVRRRGPRGPLDACLFVSEHSSPDGRLAYLGPAFSRRGAYVRAFEEIVRSLCETEGPFALAMEVETAAVMRMLRR